MGILSINIFSVLPSWTLACCTFLEVLYRTIYMTIPSSEVPDFEAGIPILIFIRRKGLPIEAIQIYEKRMTNVFKADLHL
ncbi:hypothetical protein F4810DRAFT_655683 [Camillea tinctor]|nr:hypothetical protein F4810DRAFT_655683 [Camillea tinctor]